MKRTGLMIFLATLALTAVARDLVILHTNDTHSQLDPSGNTGGILQRKALIDSIRAAEPNVLLVDAGDIVQGSLYFKYFRGEVEYPLFEMMDYDIRILGNHEFDNGMEELAREYRKIQKSSRLASNYDFTGTALDGVFEPYVIKKIDGKKIGFIALNVNPKGLISKKNFQGVYKDPVATANELAAFLKKKKGCDLVVVVSHIGYEKETPGNPTDVEVAQASKDIDIIIGGHTHTSVTPGRDGKFPSIVDNAEGRPVLITQTGKYGRNLGYIKIDLDNLKGETPEDFEYRLIPVTNRFPEEALDKRMADFMEPYRHKVDSVNARPIAVAAFDMPNGLTTGALANFTADFGKWYGQMVIDSIGPIAGHDKLDLALMNVGGIRMPMHKGIVSEGQILNTYPFSNYYVLTLLKGSDLIDVMRGAAIRGGEAVSSDVRVVLAGDKVEKVFIGFDEVNPDKEYLVGTINYIAEGNDNMDAMRNGRIVWQDEKEVAAPIMRYVVMFGERGLPIAPDSSPRFIQTKP